MPPSRQYDKHTLQLGQIANCQGGKQEPRPKKSLIFIMMTAQQHIIGENTFIPNLTQPTRFGGHKGCHGMLSHGRESFGCGDCCKRFVLPGYCRPTTVGTILLLSSVSSQAHNKLTSTSLMFGYSSARARKYYNGSSSDTFKSDILRGGTQKYNQRRCAPVCPRRSKPILTWKGMMQILSRD